MKIGPEQYDLFYPIQSSLFRLQLFFRELFKIASYILKSNIKAAVRMQEKNST